VVVPGTPVSIAPAGDEPHVSTPNDVLIYDGDVRYRRRLIDRRGDNCLFWVVSWGLAAELGLLPAARGGGATAPRLRRRPLAGPVYAHSRLLRAAARAGADPLAVDEWALTLLCQATRAARTPGPAGRAGPAGSAESGGWRDAVEEVKRLLAAHPERVWTLAGLGRVVHYSPFALARAFRRLTGYSVHGYRRELRLRDSLEDVLDGDATFSDVAVEHGFANHSHYTAAFRRAFGHTPSRLRRCAAAAQLPSTYTVSPIAADTSRSGRRSPLTSPSPTAS
jgi:AraC-like DNA-binding protein